jgi:PAS domain S-box-containing protein
MVANSHKTHHITLFSETDSSGTIIFANEEFCRVSKYTQEELLGRKHNIVRHPDMPAKFFDILWRTIRAGKVFKGIIKNRAKDGSHYWVQAIIMPVINNNNQVIKYISVRHLIRDEEQAEELFQQQADQLHL